MLRNIEAILAHEPYKDREEREREGGRGIYYRELAHVYGG